MSDTQLVESLVGCTITRAAWFDQSPDEEWAEHHVAQLWLSDGRIVEFGAWGYDAWGATVRELIGVVDVERCLHCGKPHQDREIVEPWPSWSDASMPHDHQFSFCADGNHVAWIGPAATPSE